LAAKLAERLGWKLYDQELTAEIARHGRSQVKLSGTVACPV